MPAPIASTTQRRALGGLRLSLHDAPHIWPEDALQVLESDVIVVFHRVM